MSVKVEQLTKIYGNQKAVDNISFEVKAGEIVGFLGPNGAGKSTTMKITTCFIPPSSGAVTVCGYNVTQKPLEVRQHIGYLPEHNPLYLDMYVSEYLNFTAKLHRIKQPQLRINDMIQITGLQQERKKTIRQLSKGYRQRVGLAQAMLHNPDVLILDEPTSGLDPNQLLEIRQVIKTLGKEKTVIFSSHIMQEVQALCDRIIIINKGVLVADDTTLNLQNKLKSSTQYTLEFAQKVAASLLKSIHESIFEVVEKENNQFSISSNSNEDLRANLFNFAVSNKLTLLTLNKENNSLENIFRQLTAN